MASLLELQRSFGAALRGDADAAALVTFARDCGLTPPANLSIYRHNAEHAFHAALGIGFPVLRRRVGDDFFRQLVHHYRARSPSRSGDLHWVGRDFPAFLAGHLDGDYAWLADLARLEWAREAASVGAEPAALGAEALATHAPEALEHLVFGLQPSLSLVESEYPVFSVWFANQADNAPPVDQSLGSECGMVRLRDDLVEVSRLAPDLFSYIRALAEGSTLGEAMSVAGVDEQRLGGILGFLFSSSLVRSLTVKAPPPEGRRQGTSS